MSNELLHPTNPHIALASYSAAFPLLMIAQTEFSTVVSPRPSGKVDFTSFTKFRELWRWVERLLWRAIVLGASVYDVHHDHHTSSTDSEEGGEEQQQCKKKDSLWTWLGHYSACSAYWPSNFRTAHRSTISVLYLRALVLRYGPESSIHLSSHARVPSGSSASTITSTPHAAVVHPSSTATTTKADNTTTPPAWLQKARSVIQEYRAILSVSTRFPKAGERNVKVEEFVDLCVAVWEVSGGEKRGVWSGWVLDVRPFFSTF
jgi:hypothetical protein